MSGIGSHTRPNDGANETWLTPLAILNELGSFDLDPCAAPSPRPWSTAARHIELPEDGLAANWGEGRIWCNPPYGRNIGKWLEKMAKHGSGIALTFARTEMDAFGWVWPYAAGVLFIAGRLHFYLPDGTRSDTKQFADYLDKCILLCGELGISVPPPPSAVEAEKNRKYSTASPAVSAQ